MQYLQPGRQKTTGRPSNALRRCAPAFLTAPAAGADQDRPIGPLHPSRTNTPVPVTVPEIRDLLAAVFTTPVTCTARLLHWSNWRR
ncbi:hypothetical protein AB0L75_05240 [Streptomyces sp. NPDC052101]|uniref:hypothetical protein n=1 Tax=Streptomyces sp. NPDC052101 TaxID=3155763 RepID=UPI00343D28B4